MITEANIATELGSIYLRKLCRHFARKVPTTLSGTRGRIEYPFGPCRIHINDQRMQIRIEINNPDDLERAEKMVRDQLIRIARPDTPTINWVRSNQP